MDIVLSWDGIGCVSSVDARCSTARYNWKQTDKINKKEKKTQKTKVIIYVQFLAITIKLVNY